MELCGEKVSSKNASICVELWRFQLCVHAEL